MDEKYLAITKVKYYFPVGYILPLYDEFYVLCSYFKMYNDDVEQGKSTIDICEKLKDSKTLYQNSINK